MQFHTLENDLCASSMATTEATQLVHITRRTWAIWESGQCMMPLAKREFFLAKLEREGMSHRQLVVILADDGHPRGRHGTAVGSARYWK
jgi:hypothetical protein